MLFHWILMHFMIYRKKIYTARLFIFIKAYQEITRCVTNDNFLFWWKDFQVFPLEIPNGTAGG